MTTKSDIDRMLDMLESFRDSVPGHVRQLLRMLAARCDEVEARLEALCYGELSDTCARCGASFQIVRPGKSQPTCDCWDDGDRETKHLLSNPKNAAVLEKSIEQAPSRILDNVHTSASRLYHAGHMSQAAMQEFDELCRAKAKREDEGSFW